MHIIIIEKKKGKKEKNCIRSVRTSANKSN